MIGPTSRLEIRFSAAQKPSPVPASSCASDRLLPPPPAASAPSTTAAASEKRENGVHRRRDEPRRAELPEPRGHRARIPGPRHLRREDDADDPQHHHEAGDRPGDVHAQRPGQRVQGDPPVRCGILRRQGIGDDEEQREEPELPDLPEEPLAPEPDDEPARSAWTRRRSPRRRRADGRRRPHRPPRAGKGPAGADRSGSRQPWGQCSRRLRRPSSWLRLSRLRRARRRRASRSPCRRCCATW